MRLQFENFMCKVCNNVFKHPTADSCGHTFCRKCLVKLIETKSKCPVSDQALNADYKSKNWAVNQMLDGAEKYCENESNGCDWKGPPRRFYKHHKHQCVFGKYNNAIIAALKNVYLKPALNYKRVEFQNDSIFEGLVNDQGKPEYGIEYSKGKISYEGEFLNGLRHGVGKWYVDDSIVIEGQFFEGLPGGSNHKTSESSLGGFAIKYVNGRSTVEGYWINGKLNGKALTYTQDGLIVKGEVKNDQYIGQRRIKYPNGRVFIGTEEDNQIKEGLLIYEDPNNIYMGTFMNNKPDGYGVLTKKGKLEYTGEFKNGVFDGKGVLKNFTMGGTTYEGDFKNGLKEGTGVLYKEWNREEYHGKFAKDQFNGEGVLIHKDTMARIIGKFVNDSIVTPCTIHFEDGRVYNGDIHNRRPEAFGTMHFPNGDVYQGSWRSGEMHDPSGNMTYANGDVFVGSFKSGERRGSGTFTYANGDKFVGTYIKDCAEGLGKLIFSDGSFLEGKWDRNKLHGVSRLFENDKLVCEMVWNKGFIVEEKNLKGSISAKSIKKTEEEQNQKNPTFEAKPKPNLQQGLRLK